MPERSKREEKLAKAVVNYLLKRKIFACTEFKKIDVVGYDKKKRTFYIVECKLGKNITKQGQAFGQILTYASLIRNDGINFVKEVHDKLKWLSYEDIAEIERKKFAPTKFYVALRKKDADTKRHADFFNWIGNQLKDIKVGVLLVNGQKCEELIKSTAFSIPLERRYTREEFFEKIKKGIRQTWPDVRVRRYGLRNLQFSFVHVGIHYEVWLKRSKKIEVGLHIEVDDAERTNRIMKYLDEQQIRKEIPEIKIQKKWGKTWARIYREIDWAEPDLDEELLNSVRDALEKFIRVLEPLLKKVKHGKRR